MNEDRAAQFLSAQRLALVAWAMAVSLGLFSTCNAQPNGTLDLSISTSPWGEITPPSACVGNFTLRTQSNVDALMGCQAIEGSLTVEPSEQLDLDPLRSLQHISGGLTLRGANQGPTITNLNAFQHLFTVGGNFVLERTLATTLSGFQNLSQIGGSLTITRNSNLISLVGLQRLESIGLDFVISNNSQLATTKGIDALSSIGRTLRIESNSKLENLEGFERITHLNGDLIVAQHSNLGSFEGLNQLEEIAGTLVILQNRVQGEFFSLHGLEGLIRIGGDFKISGNWIMSTMEGLDNLMEVGGDFIIDGQSTLTSFQGLENLTQVRGEFQIIGNNSVENMAGFSGLIDVREGVFIQNNSFLTTLQGLEKLTQVGGSLAIVSNFRLIDISALENIQNFTGISTIQNNHSLICPIFQLPFFPIQVTSGNALDCNEEATSVCQQSIFIASQEDVDAVAGCEFLVGDLTIGPSVEPLDLSVFRLLKQVVGKLSIVDNPFLIDLDDFQSLNGISGGLSIENNDLLEDIGGLANLSILGGTVSINNNPRLRCPTDSFPFPAHDSEGNRVDCLLSGLWYIGGIPSQFNFGYHSTRSGPSSPIEISLTAFGESNDFRFQSEGLRFSGANPGDFSFLDPDLSPMSHGETRIFLIVFDPSSAGRKTAAFEFLTNSWYDRVYPPFRLSGFGIDPKYKAFVSSARLNSGGFGSSLTAVPDADGDGFGEVAIGAPGEGLGRVSLYDASQGNLIAAVVSTATNGASRFGTSVAGLEDLNGNGAGEILTGAPQEASGKGRAYVHDASSGELIHVLSLPADSLSNGFGTAVARVPDINGDGFPEMAVGSPDPRRTRGAVSLFDGASGALLRTLVSPIIYNFEVGEFGQSVCGVEDLSGDSRGDLLVGAPAEDPGTSPVDAGRVYLFSGTSGAPLREFRSPNETVGGNFGDSVSGVPDTNGDGLMEILVGAPAENLSPGIARAGRAYLFDGATGALLFELRSPNKEIEGRFGASVAGVRDVDGDGTGDLLIGAPNETPEESLAHAGRVYVFSGVDGHLVRTIRSQDEEVDGHFGAAVAGLGDLDGDGLGDLGIGAPGENHDLGPVDAGNAYVIYSSAARIEFLPSGMNFGPQGVQYGPSSAAPAVLSNRGEADLRFHESGLEIAGDHPEDFLVREGLPPYPLIPGASEEIALAFDPTAPGTRTAVLRVRSNDPSKRILEIPLQGIGTIVTADQNSDTEIDSLDLLQFLSEWKAAGKGTGAAATADLNGDGALDETDLYLFADQWKP